MPQPQEELDLVTDHVHGEIKTLLDELEIKNYTTDVTPGSIRGDNYLGIIARVDVNGQDKTDKKTVLHLIVKSAPRNEFFRSLAPIHELYEREIYIYTEIFPAFNKFQEDRLVLNPFNSFAKCYKGTLNNLNEALILENMKELGYQLRDRHEPLNYNHVLLVMKEYGKFHAISYAMRDQQPELFRKLTENSADIFFDSINKNEKFKQTILEYSTRVKKALDPVVDKIAYDKFEKFQERIIETVHASVQSENAGEYAVMGHGDSWVNNMLFKYENPSKPVSPVKVCLLDWQLARLGSPALDLSYFIFTCTDKELRDQHYEHLIQEYYSSLCSLLRELGSDPEKLLPFAVLQEHLKKFCVYGLYMSVMVLHLMTSDVDEIPDIHNIVDDDDAMESWNYESKNVEKYNSRVKGIIWDFVKYDYDI